MLRRTSVLPSEETTIRLPPNVDFRDRNQTLKYEIRRTWAYLGFAIRNAVVKPQAE